MYIDNYYHVRDNVRKAALEAGYGKGVTLVAVSKMHSAEEILEVYEAGQREFGENRPQELVGKYEVLPKDIRWHMIGQLQTNKVKYIIDKVCMIHSVDSLKLAQTIDKEAAKHDMVMDVLIEVNVGREPQKGGVFEEEVPSLLQEISQLSHLHVKGLMCIPPADANMAESRNYFRILRNLSIDIKALNIDNIQMDILSMGMSDDYEAAIEEGADIVRVGTGIFGMREYNIM